MAAELLLGGEEITRRVKLLGSRVPGHLNIATYGFGVGYAARDLLASFRSMDVLVGVFRPEEVTKAQAFYSWLLASNLSRVRIRALWYSHMKVFVAPGRHPAAIVGSMNLGGGSTYEVGVLLTGTPARELATEFEHAWNAAKPLEPLDLRAMAAAFAESSFSG